MKKYHSLFVVLIYLITFTVLQLTAKAQMPAVPGFAVSHYATITDPVYCAFAPDGTLYTGRDAFGSGVGSGDAVPVHRVTPGGVSVVEYGPAIEDPDAVFFDATGEFSGTPGSVLVGGVSGSGGTIRAILPDLTLVTVAANSANYGNPGLMRLDRAGRLLFLSTSPGIEGIWAISPGGSPTHLVALPGGITPARFEVDSENRIYISGSDGVIRLCTSSGVMINDSVATGLTNANIAFGAGGAFGNHLWLGVPDGRLLTMNPDTSELTLRGEGFTNITDLIFGPDGALYVSQFDNDRVLRITPALKTNDLWDINQGTVMTTNSGAGPGALENMFGGTLSSPEPGTAFFRDNRGAGFVHSVEWQTPAPLRLTGFHLNARDDGAATGGRRGFSEFRLYARDPLTQEFNFISSYTPGNPYPAGVVDLIGVVTPVVAQEFRAEFVQFFSGTFPGPRIVELDGFGEVSELIVYEGFNYDVGDLRGENGGAGDWTGPWVAGSGFGSGNSWQIHRPSLSYSDSTGRILQTSGGAAYGTAESSITEFRETRPWSTAGRKDEDDVLWFSFLFNRSSDASNDARVMIAGNGDLFTGLGIFINEDNISARINTQNDGHKSFSTNEDHFVVGRIKFLEGEAEVRYWLDPELGEVPHDNAPDSGVNTATVNAASWNNFYLRHHGNPGLDIFDEIRIGTDFFSVAPIVQCAPPPSNLVGWWRGEENALDSISGNHGTFANSNFTSGIVGQAFHFTGSQFVQIPDVPALDFTNAFSVEFWVSPTVAGQVNGTTFLVGKGNMTMPNTHSYGVLFNDDRRVFMRIANGSELDQLPSANPLPLGIFSHVAATYDGSEMRVYVNGVLENSGATSIGTLFQSNEGLVIGGADFTGGKILSQAILDEVSIYSRALTEQEVASIYASSSAGKCIPCVEPPSNIVSWWRAESSGLDSVSTNNASLLNGVGFAPGKVGTAYNFDGTNDIAAVAGSRFVAVSNNFTMEMWVNPIASRGSTSESTSGGSGISSGQRYAIFPTHGDSLGANHAGAGISIGTNGISVFEHAGFYIPSLLVYNAPILGWNHVAVVYTNNRPSLYLNGQLVRTGLQSSRIIHPSAEKGGGVYGYYAGLMDEYTIYSRALTPSEVAAIFNSGSSGKCAPPDVVNPLLIAPATTNLIVGQSVTFSASGGKPPLLFSLATNNSGGSINAFSGIYVAGPVANVADTVRVSDSLGSSITATVNVQPDPAPRPDLAIHSISAPATIQPSVPFELMWVVTNRGAATAIAPWTERAFVSTDNLAGNDSFLAAFSINAPLDAGGSITRTQLVTIPLNGDAGTLHFVLAVDSGAVVNESNEANNVGVSVESSSMPFLLSLTPATSTVTEGQSATFTVTRNGSRATALLVNLLSSDTTELAVPATITVPSGAASVTFNAVAQSDALFDGQQSVTLTANANGFPESTATVTVTDSDTPRLFLTFATNYVVEGSSFEAVVSRELVTTEPLTIGLSGGNGQLAFPGSVVIPASSNSVAFNVIALGDTFIESTNTHSLTASAAGFLSANNSVTIEDDDLPNVVITLSLQTASENAGANAITATATRDRNSPRALSLALSSSNTNAARVPAFVTIPASQTNVTFPIAIVDNNDVDGTRMVTINGMILATIGNAPLRAAQPAVLTVTDDDGPALKLTLARELVGEGLNPATTGTISRNTGTSGALQVNLVSSDTTEATVPDSVIIPDGTNAITFPITSLNDGTNDGNQIVTIDATATDFAPSSATLVVSDTDLPDLLVASVVAPTNAVTGQQFPVTFRIENQGLAPAGTNFLQRVLISSDPQVGDDTILAQTAFNGSIPVGSFFEQTLNIFLPQTPGDYWLVATVDANNQVAEGLENNNTRVTAVPVTVAKAYSATVSASVETAPTGTPVLLSGHATLTANGQPAAFEIVSVHLTVRGTKRILSALTDSSGNYAVTFNPLPGEAGDYSVGADHPGISNPITQDNFTLLGMRVPAQQTLRIVAGASGTNSTFVENLSDIPLTGLTAEVLSGPTNLALTFEFGTTALPGDGTVPLKLILTSPSELAGSGTFRVRVNSAEGASGEFDLPVLVESLVPKLTVTPGSLSAGMRRGRQANVEFSITNNGGAATGPITVLLPALPWMALSSGAQISPLAPGEGATVTLLLTPPVDLPLGNHSGSLVVNASNASVSVPFTFRSLSDNIGTLKLTAVDELTFYAEGSPKLTNATVRLSVPETGETVLATNFNGLDELILTNLVEAYYTLRVDAPDHAPYQDTFLLKPAETNEVIAFLSWQTVRYTWTVTPVTIEDRYEIVVETTFETSVPLPVITVEPSVIDVANFPGETKQVDLKITNHGLLAALNSRLSFGSHPYLAITPLIGEIGVLPAQSSLTIPVTLRKIGVAPKVSAAAEGENPCHMSGKLEWDIICAGQPITHSVQLNVQNLNQILDNVGFECGTSAQTFFVAGGVPAGLNFAAIGGIGNPGYDAPISFAEESVCDPCIQEVGGNLLQNCLPLSPLPFEGPDNEEECEAGAGTLEQLVACFQDTLDDLGDALSDPLETVGDLADALGDDGGGLGDAGDAIDSGLDSVGDALDIARCLAPLFDPCLGGVGGGGPGGGGPGGPDGSRPANGMVSAASDDEPNAAGAPITAPLIHRINQVLAFMGGHTNLLGSDIWFKGTNIVAWTNWMSSFTARMNTGTEEGSRISATERSELLALPFPEPVTTNDVTRLLDRWNRTVDYFDAGIFNRTNVPSGQSLDFIALDERREVLAAARAAHAAAVAEGFNDVTHAYNLTRRQTLDLMFGQTGGVCAKVRLRLEQQVVISRDAFKANLEIENNTGSPLEEIGVNLLITDEEGSDRTALFQIRPPTLNGISAVDGTGIQPASSTGSSSWLLVPSSLSAPMESTRYFVSGTLTYRQDGTTLTIPLAPTAIDVLPNPKLIVDYFHERDVFSDDPFTPEIEPAIPYSLAVRIRNEGFGVAQNFRITSAQPEIVDNEKGLFINFEIIATEVGGVGLTPALTANFGNIDPGSIAVGRWLFRSSLQGLFTHYEATFEHVSGLGDRRFSLIDSVNIHEMIHLVHADRSFDDGLPDFLANDVPDLGDLPDTLHFSDGSNAPVSVVLDAEADAPVSPTHLTVQLTATMPTGWTYLRVPDPADANYRLIEVRRTDNSLVALDRNVWRTDRTFIGFGQRPLRENKLHLLDFDSAGSYTLVYESASLSADTNPPASTMLALSSASPATFNVMWSGNDGTNGSGIAYFDIFVSVNGGTFTNWLAQTTAGGAIFEGLPDETYAFYSRATDAAGNTEPAPLNPDAETSTSIINSPPILDFLPDVTASEGTTVMITATASDADNDTISYLLGVGSPSGMVLNGQNGQITWTTGEAHGPSTNQITLIARDNGVPPLSATQTFLVIVLESNMPPTLAAITNRTISENVLLTFTNLASDADLPKQQLTFSLGANSPDNASVNATNGIFIWRPNETQGGTTNVISVIVTDDGPPSLSTTQTFAVVVLDTLPDFKLGLGTTSVLSGASGAIPLTLQSGVDLTNLHLVLVANGNRLTNLNLTGFASQVGSANIFELGSNRFDVRFESQAGALLQGNLALAQLGFTTISNEHSAIVRLSAESLVGLSASSASSLNGAANLGRVFIVGEEPILDVGIINQSIALTLYAIPGERYAIESGATLDGTNQWTFDSFADASATALRTDLPLRPVTQSMEFFRARLAPSSVLSIGVQSGEIVIEWLLNCVGCVLEESEHVGPNANWTPSAAQPEEVNGRYRVSLPSANAQRFYRLVTP